MCSTCCWQCFGFGITMASMSMHPHFQRFEMYNLVDSWGDRSGPAWWLWSSYWLVAIVSYIFLHPSMFQLFQNRLSFSVFWLPYPLRDFSSKGIGPFEPNLKHLSCRESQSVPRIGLGREWVLKWLKMLSSEYTWIHLSSSLGLCLQPSFCIQARMGPLILLDNVHSFFTTNRAQWCTIF